MSAALVAEARETAAMHRHAGHEHGIEPLLDRLAGALENATITLREDAAYIKHLEAMISDLELTARLQRTSSLAVVGLRPDWYARKIGGAL